uniref:ATP-dependent DNA helicase n=1 Tax=Globodera pallida TaxID=36090 RepID=A0A183C4Y9_GLOPA
MRGAEEEDSIFAPAAVDESILMPPPRRRSTRQRKAPQRYSSSSLERWPDFPISRNCKNNSHTGFCASLSANHTPRYYNTLVPFGDNRLYRCPHCAALLLKSEATGAAAFSKCCAKGQVKMEQQFYELQRPFLRPGQRLQNDEDAHNLLDNNSKQLDNLLNDLIMGRHLLSNNFIKMVDRFNHELAFGTATTEQKPVPGGYQPVKMNGMVTYRLSGLNPPRNADGLTREELCGQVWTLNPDNAIDLRKRRNLDAGLRLEDNLLELLHRLLAHQQIGHPLAGLYFHLKRVYEEAKQQQADGEAPPVDNLRIRLLTRGEVMRQNLPEVHNIHPHQLQLPESVDQLAQLFFVDGDDGLPPAAEQGVMLKTKNGALTVLPWWDNWIDGALCPLLFPRGGSVWKPSLSLAKPDSAAPLPSQPSDQEVATQHVVPTLAEEDVEWQNNPYADEEEDILAEADDYGEGEQLLLDAEPKKVHHVSRSQAARYMMQLRAPPRHAGNQLRNAWHDPHWLWWARRLAEFFVCLLNNRIDRDKFANIKKNQLEQRSILPAHLVRHFEREARKQLDHQGQPLGARAQLGRIFLAPRTLRGSRAYYQLQFADAMAICRQLGAPHLLITFTMNSAAKEFETMLWEGQRWYNRPDVSDRLFIDKSKEFLKDIVQRQVMGPVKAWFYSVEHQERGLPHIHLCLILDFARMHMSMEDYIDDYISAEIPELPRDGDNSHAARLQRLFRRFILDNMYHTCSPRYCLVDGKCTKHFPRPFAEQTVIDDRIVGVQYRRRPPAQSESERLQSPERFACAVSGKDNRFVVPHNRFLALNINVEWIQGDACIKYVLKYVMKGCQLAFVQIVNDTTATTAGTVVVNYDEFRQIRMARYQTPNEALLSIWGNKIVRKSHQVQHQRFHLPGQNRIVVLAGREEERAEEERERIEAEQDQQTPLTAYFTLNATIGPALAQEHTFLTICNAYWYDRQANQWKTRAQQRKNHLAMLEAASAGNPEHQALRMLLLHVRGPTGWDVLYDGHATFVEAARAMGLLEDSSIWVNTILEALSGLPTFRRRLNWTAVLFANSGILDASSVLDRVLLDSRRLLTPRAMRQHGLEANRQYVLFRMELVFRLHGVVPGNFNSCCERLGLPAPVGFVMPPEDIIEAEFNAGDYGNRMWAQLMQGDNEQNDSATDGPMTTAQYAAKDAEFRPQLNDKQRSFLDAVCASVIRRRNATLEPAQQLTLRGSRAYYQLQFADAMAICRQLGAPHLLITFTMNSAAKEFETMLWEGQRWYNRPDVSDRLFIDKSKEFLKDIVQRQVMGPVKAWFYSVEHQERGLPHIHLCLILDFARMHMSMEDYIDDYISAEIPELPRDGDNSHAARLQRLFRRFILDNMYHTCSPRYCLVDGKCTKHFPRPFAEQTVIDDRIVGVQYRRRPPAQSESERLQSPERFACAVSGKDNRFVVPHNRFLALNINVEWIQGDACIKYVLKYVMKGCQLAFVQIVNDTTATTAGTVVVNYDEFRQIRMARYQTPNEALLSIWGNKIVRKSHQVQHQRFHLPGQNRIVVLAGREEERAEEERERIEAEQDQQTPLTAYFTLNATIGPALAQEHTFLTICNAYWRLLPATLNIRRCECCCCTSVVQPVGAICMLAIQLSSKQQEQWASLKILQYGSTPYWRPFLDCQPFAAASTGLLYCSQTLAFWTRLLSSTKSFWIQGAC